ncbi:MAG TPA: ABC transporter permease subunit [Nitrospiria bacterium]|nr:ABC transporter permease subunit [Nitrospiria bacterium]
MKSTLAIAGKELRVLFNSPIAYVVTAIFILISGYLFYSIVLFASSQSMQIMRVQGALPQINLNDLIFRPTFHNMAVILMLTLPLITMRLLAEEKKTKTMELLMTSPVPLTSIVLGKYLAAMAVFTLMLALTAYMPFLMWYYGSVQWMPILTGYLGIWLLGGVFIAVGLLASSLTENQIIASFIGFGAVLILWLIGWISQTVTDSSLGSLLTYLSIGEHTENFIKGMIDTEDLVYQLTLIIVGLFITHRVLESQRWK